MDIDIKTILRKSKLKNKSGYRKKRSNEPGQTRETETSAMHIRLEDLVFNIATINSPINTITNKTI